LVKCWVPSLTWLPRLAGMRLAEQRAPIGAVALSVKVPPGETVGVRNVIRARLVAACEAVAKPAAAGTREKAYKRAPWHRRVPDHTMTLGSTVDVINLAAG